MVLAIFQGSESKQRKKEVVLARSPTSKERRHTPTNEPFARTAGASAKKRTTAGGMRLSYPTRKREPAVPPQGMFCVESKKKARQSNRWVCDPDQTSSPLLRGQNLLPVITPCEMKSQTSLRIPPDLPPTKRRHLTLADRTLNVQTKCPPSLPSNLHPPPVPQPLGLSKPPSLPNHLGLLQQCAERARSTAPKPTQMRAHNMNTS